MRSFQAGRLDPVPGDVVMRLGRLDRAAGAESSFADHPPQLLDALRRQARVESVTASSAIEGVLVAETRVPRLLDPAARRFRNRSEEEFVGYRSALEDIHQQDPGALGVGLVLHLHRLVFAFTDGPGGAFKTVDDLGVDLDADGARRIRFRPTSAAETPFAVQELVARTNDALAGAGVHPLIVVAAFTLDLLCIHPFADGNGRVARLLSSYLLERSGYHVGRYVSLEQLVFDARDEYYDSLAASTTGWFDEGSHDVWPWVRFFLDRLDEAYTRFEARVAAGRSGGTKQDRVRDYVLLYAPSPFAIADIRRAVPGISDNTIRLVLSSLRAAGRIVSDGTGRSATWQRR